MPLKQKNVHLITEAAGVFAVAPLLWYIGGKLTGTDMMLLRAVAVGTAAVDGFLLLKFDDW
jgi:hypothetical protein